DVGGFIGGESPLAAILPDRMAIHCELAFPGLYIIEYGHGLRADHGESPLAVRVEPGSKKVSADSAGEHHVQMGEIRKMIEQRRSFASHFDGQAAGNGEDHRKIVRRQIPERVIFRMELAKPEPVRMNVADFAQFAL